MRIALLKKFIYLLIKKKDLCKCLMIIALSNNPRKDTFFNSSF